MAPSWKPVRVFPSLSFKPFGIIHWMPNMTGDRCGAIGLGKTIQTWLTNIFNSMRSMKNNKRIFVELLVPPTLAALRLCVFSLLALLLSACVRQEHAKPSSVVVKQVNSESEAIAVVLADIQHRGGDPRREECSAIKTDRGWDVTAWHIFNPTNTGSSRFAPGGFTDYAITKDGRILEAIPGY